MTKNRRSLGVANILCSKGRVNFLDVLETKRPLYQSDDQLAVSEQAVSLNLIAPYNVPGEGGRR